MVLIRRARKSRPALRKKRALRRRFGLRRRMGGKRVLNANKMDRATVIETQEYTAVVEGGQTVTHQLNQNPRALAVSANFRFYRCKKVELEFIPYANLFAPGTAFPELYFQVDRTLDYQPPANVGPGISVLPTKGSMLSKGVMPVKWTNIVKRSYVPSVLRNENFIQNVLGSDVQSIAAIASTPVKYKWYTTQAQFNTPPGNAASVIAPSWNPQSLTYFGAAYYVDQPLAPVGAVLGTIKMRVHWEFKQPRSEISTNAEAPTSKPPALDISGSTL